MNLFEKLFGFTLSDKDKKKIQTPVRDETEDVVEYVEAPFGFQSSLPNFDFTSKDENDLIIQYRDMALLHEVDSAIDDIVNEAIVTTEYKEPVSIILDDIPKEKLSDKLKDKIEKEFDEILKLLRFRQDGYEIFKSWYIDGRLYYYKVVDEKNKKRGIIDLKKVDSTSIKKVREEVTEVKDGVEMVKNEREYFKYFPKKKIGNTYHNTSQPIELSVDSVSYVHSGIVDQRRNIVLGFLNKAIKPMNQLKMLEDATVIYRLSRAPERRIFYIDVGSMTKTKAEQYIQSVMKRHKNKMVYDASTGQVKDKRDHLAMVEDYYLPRREGGKGTEIDTLQGGQNLGELSDVEYFKRKFYKALNVPVTRIETENTFNLGRASEITRDEVKFSKWITRLRLRFSHLFLDILKTQVVLKNIMDTEDWEEIEHLIKFDYVSDSYFQELKENEILRERVEMVQGVDEYVGKYFSKEWVRKNILRQSDQDIEEIDKQIEKEDKDDEINKFDPDEAAAGDFEPQGPIDFNKPEEPGPEPEDQEREAPPDEQEREDQE